MNRIARTLLILIITGFGSEVLSGQEEALPSKFTSEVRTLALRNIGPRTYEDIDGTPYYTKDYVDAVVFLKDGNRASLPLRYDMFADEIEFKKGDKTLWLLKNTIKYIRYGTDMIFVSSEYGDSTKPGYFFLMDNGKTLLFYKKVVRYEPMVPAKAYTESIPERFVPDKPVIFIRRENMAARKIILRKDLTEYFNGYPEALSYLKANKVRPDNLEELHKFVSFLNDKQ